MDAEHTDVTKLQEVVRTYDKAAAELDDKVTLLENEIGEIKEAIDKEREDLAGPTENEKLNLKVSIGVFADFEGEIKIALIYGLFFSFLLNILFADTVLAVRNASWTAGYDIRVDMQTKENPVSLVYKGAITQNTGEDWNDVPLTLETATPTFGVDVPTLQPWTLRIHRSYGYAKSKSISFGSAGSRGSYMAPPGAMMSLAAPTDSLGSSAVDEIQHRGLHVSSKGNISATFSVPGLINIPSDNVGHNVTIVKLSLDASLSWLCVPKKDSRVHLKAKIKNASDYTLLPGSSSVYVDGSFISKSEVPLVSPEESFDCPLG